MKSVKSILFLLAICSEIFAQIKPPESPTMNNGFGQPGAGTSSFGSGYYNSNLNGNFNSQAIEDSKTFSPSYKAPVPNASQNEETRKILDLFKEANIEQQGRQRKELWELKLKSYNFINPNSEVYTKLKPYYDAAYDSINDMLAGRKRMDLKRAVFLVENAYYGNKMNYYEFCEFMDQKLLIINQIIRDEKLSHNNNVALNYAIQQLYLRPVQYLDRDGIVKEHQPFKYDFDDYMGDYDYSKQFVSKLLYTGKGQCHSMPLLYMILANEIGANASIAYSPEHSYIVFPDNDNNFYNFECTSGCFPSYSFVMSSGYVSREAVKSGIYTVPTTLKETVAAMLNDLAAQDQYQFKGVDDFQLKCAKRTLEFFPNDIMALMTVADYQTAKTDATICYAGYPPPKDIPNYPEIKKEFDERNKLYQYIDDLGYSSMPQNEYNEWLQSINLAKAKQESEEIKTVIFIKAKLKD